MDYCGVISKLKISKLEFENIKDNRNVRKFYRYLNIYAFPVELFIRDSDVLFIT